MPRTRTADKTAMKALNRLGFGLVLVALYMPAAWANDAPAVATPTAEVPSAKGKIVASPAMKPEMGWKPGLAGSILSSRFAAQHKDIAEAAKYLSESLKRDPENEALQQEAMRAHVLAGNIEEAVALASILQLRAAEDPLVATLLMIDAHHRGAFAEAKHVLSKPSDRGLFGIIRPVLEQWITVSEGGLKSPVDLQASIDKSGFFAPFLFYHAALLNDVLGFEDIARKNYDKASADPAVTPYRVVEVLANFHLRHGEKDKARALFKAYEKENPESNLLPEDTVFAGNDVPAALVATPAEGMAELFFATASILFGEELTNESFIYLRLALALRPDMPPAQLMLANLYESNGEYREAIRIYDSIKPGSVFYKRALIRRAVNLEALGKVDESVSQLQALSEKYPNDESALITLGDIYREQGLYEDAIEAYGEAISRMGTLRSVDWPLFYARGIAYERAGMWNAAERDFFRALELEPNQPDVMNYLGYSWLVMGKNLEKAKSFIEIALSARPDDAHILDSMGWAYFVLGDYVQAVALLERAADLMPQDATVNDHLGDVYWRVGRKTEAEYQWKRALSFDPTRADEERIRHKIAHGLPDTASVLPKKEAHNNALPVEVR
ncbi:MAG: hypothetical protein C0436_03140 [Alphaproteobacteria bacterium]|nr:hypothetical protein [Alphaproteobacteria bacterium]